MQINHRALLHAKLPTRIPDHASLRVCVIAAGAARASAGAGGHYRVRGRCSLIKSSTLLCHRNRLSARDRERWMHGAMPRAPSIRFR